MAYAVNKSNGDEITVQDNTLNTDTSLFLVGKNFPGYGEYIAENFVHLLEHFAEGTPPENPTPGQLWYNNIDDTWSYFTNQGEWSFVGLASAKPLEILDTSGLIHIVTAFYDENSIVSLVSTESFDVAPTDPVYAQFPVIGQGITMGAGGKFHGTATSAEYADLAEMYKSDKMYIPGTVVKIGGVEEVTHTASPYSDDVFGIVSTDPAYLMNSKCPGVAVALEGRVPCQVIGKVSKGDRLVSSDVPGVAMVGEPDKVTWKNQVGRALEHKETEELGLVEVVVGAK